jgi:hypothetical protein
MQHVKRSGGLQGRIGARRAANRDRGPARIGSRSQDLVMLKFHIRRVWHTRLNCLTRFHDNILMFLTCRQTKLARHTPDASFFILLSRTPVQKIVEHRPTRFYTNVYIQLRYLQQVKSKVRIIPPSTNQKTSSPSKYTFTSSSKVPPHHQTTVPPIHSSHHRRLHPYLAKPSSYLETRTAALIAAPLVD